MVCPVTGFGVGVPALLPDVQARCSWEYGLPSSDDVAALGAGIQLPFATAFWFSVSAVKIANVPVTWPYASAPPATSTRRAAAAAHLRAWRFTPLRLERDPARSRRA